jgi:hypothetical protein
MATNRIGFNTDFVLFNNNVGIGLTNPTRKLDVNGEIRLRSGLYDSFNNVGANYQTYKSRKKTTIS